MRYRINTSATGVLNASGGSTLLTFGTSVYSGYVGNGTINLTNGVTFNASANVAVGWLSGAAVGLLNVTGATLNMTSATGHLYIGGAGRATLQLGTGGIINYAGTTPAVGTNSASGSIMTFNLSGGTFNDSSGMYVANLGASVLNESSGTFNAGNFGVQLTEGAGGRGTLNLTGGLLEAGALTPGPGTSTLNLSGGTVVLLGTTETIGGFSAANVLAGGTTAFNANGGAVTITQSFHHDSTNGAPATDGGLSLVGPGSFTMSGTNTYTGGTTLSGGATLSVTNAAALGTGPLSFGSGTTIGGPMTITAPITVNTGGVLEPAYNSTAAASTLHEGTLTMSTGADLTESISSKTLGSDEVVITGDLDLAAGNNAQLALADIGSAVVPNNTVFTLATYTGNWNGDTFASYPDNSTFTLNGNHYEISYDNHAVTLTGNPAAVPEPVSLGTLSIAGIGLLARRRRTLPVSN